MSRGACRTGVLLIFVLISTAATWATDLEVVVHDSSPTGPGVENLDLLLCKSGPCTAVATTDGKGRAVFEDVDAGDLSIRAMTIGCGPWVWSVTVKPSQAPQKVDVVVPATGRLAVRVTRLERDGSTVPLAGERVEFLIKTQTSLPAFPQFSGTTTDTDDKGYARLCLPAGVELEVSAQAQGFQPAALPRQQLKPGEAASAQIVLGTKLAKQP